MTKEEIEALVKSAAKEAAREAIKDTFLLMGVTIDKDGDVLQMQKDFQHLREAREGKEEFVRKGKSAVMAVFITGVLALIAKGFWADLQGFVLKVVSGGN